MIKGKGVNIIINEALLTIFIEPIISNNQRGYCKIIKFCKIIIYKKVVIS